MACRFHEYLSIDNATSISRRERVFVVWKCNNMHVYQCRKDFSFCSSRIVLRHCSTLLCCRKGPTVLTIPSRRYSSVKIYKTFKKLKEKKWEDNNVVSDSRVLKTGLTLFKCLLQFYVFERWSKKMQSKTKARRKCKARQKQPKCPQCTWGVHLQ